jgi:hypothetical protein
MTLLWREHESRSWLLDETQKQEILRLHRAGASMRTLARRFGLRSHASIASIVRTRTRGRRVQAA